MHELDVQGVTDYEIDEIWKAVPIGMPIETQG